MVLNEETGNCPHKRPAFPTAQYPSCEKQRDVKNKYCNFVPRDNCRESLDLFGHLHIIPTRGSAVSTAPLDRSGRRRRLDESLKQKHGICLPRRRRQYAESKCRDRNEPQMMTKGTNPHWIANRATSTACVTIFACSLDSFISCSELLTTNELDTLYKHNYTQQTNLNHVHSNMKWANTTPQIE